MIIDFEGEPSQPLSERRAKDSGWRDVAGVLRSLDYGLSASQRVGPSIAQDGRYESMAAAFRQMMQPALLQSYRDALSAQDVGVATIGDRDTNLLNLFMLEKAAYEINYEVSNRPDWLSVPLRGFSELIGQIMSENAADE